MSRVDRFAVLLSILSVVVISWASQIIFDRLPHLEDEIAYVWQARIIANGHLFISSPPEASSFMVPFVIDYNGQRFSKYPPAWPVVLSLGEKIGARWLVNSLLAGVSIWLTYRLGKKIVNEKVGFLAALLTLTSPFFIINASSLLSHIWSLDLSLFFAIAWLDSFDDHGKIPRWLTNLVAGLSLGLLGLTRPLTAVGVVIPFAVHGIILLLRSPRQVKLQVLSITASSILVSMLLLLWQYAASGDPLRNLYTLWWSYDRIGFGPGIGLAPSGHNLTYSIYNLEFSLLAGTSDLFGWGNLSWIFLPFGLWAVRRNKKAWLYCSVILSVIAVYMLYWIGSWVFGPRYYFEGLFCLSILTATGILYLAGKSLTPDKAWRNLKLYQKIRPVIIAALTLTLISANLVYYLPLRFGKLNGYNQVSADYLVPFLASQANLTPALVFVDTTKAMTGYFRLLEIESPVLDSPYIFAINSTPKQNLAVIDAYPNRTIYYYNPDDPFFLGEAR